MFKKLLDLLFPEKCIKCQAKGILLCENCLINCKPAHLNEYGEIRSLFSYKDPTIKKALWLLKYKNKKNVAEILGAKLVELIREEIVDIKTLYPNSPILIVPVPLARKRLRERGYNQCELLARTITKEIPDLALENNLVQKIKETIPQAHMKNKKDRLQNLKDCFLITEKEKVEKKILGSQIILLDDITTTGATLFGIKKVLNRAGARSVHMYSVAH